MTFVISNLKIPEENFFAMLIYYQLDILCTFSIYGAPHPNAFLRHCFPPLYTNKKVLMELSQQ